MDTATILQLAEEAARDAGGLLLQRFRGPARGIGTKTTDTDLVSDADRDAERLILRLVRSRRPDDGVVAEEGGGAESVTGLRWIVDPLDGTVNFLYGIPTWCVSIGVEDDAGAVVGVVHDPARDETFTAVRGEGAWLNRSPISVSSKRELSTALVGTGFAYSREVRSRQAAVVARLLPQVRDIRRAGSAALDLCYLACGRLDAFYEAHMNIWDRSAGVLLVAEAGGEIEDLPAPDGSDSTGVMAAPPGLMGALRSLVGRG